MNGHQRHGVIGAGGDSDLILLELEKDADMSKQCLCPVISMTKGIHLSKITDTPQSSTAWS